MNFEFESSRTFPGPFAKNGSSSRTFPGQNKIPGHFQDFQDEWPSWVEEVPVKRIT